MRPIVYFVDKQSSLVKSYWVSSDHIFASVLKHEFVLLVDRESNLIIPVHWENDFSHFIQLVVQDLATLVPSRLELLDHCHHELAVDKVVKSISAVLVLVFLSLHLKYVFVRFDETFEQTLVVDLRQ